MIDTGARTQEANLPKKLAKYVEMLRITVLTDLAYAYDMLSRQLFLAVVMFVFVQLWSATYRWEGAASIGGYTMRQMLWYLALTESMAMSMPRTAADIDDDVRSGSLAYSLTKPYKYPWFLYAKHMGKALVGFFGNLALAGAVIWIAVGPPPVTALSSALGFLSAFLAYTLDFWAQVAIGLCAFWIEDGSPYRLLYSRVKMLLGGMLLPLELFPDGLRRFVAFLPVGQIFHGPVKSFVSLSLHEFAGTVAKQAVWIFVFIVLAGAVYRAGVRRVNVQGG
ncbi:MAG: ABC transporter permease [Bacillota bacterium]